MDLMARTLKSKSIAIYALVAFVSIALSGCGGGEGPSAAGTAASTGSGVASETGSTRSTVIPEIKTVTVYPSTDSVIVTWFDLAFSDAKTYKFYRDSEYVYSSTRNGWQMFGDEVIDGERYCYQISAVNQENVESALSDSVCIIGGSEQTSYLRQLAELQRLEVSDKNTLTLNWDVNTEKPNQGYKIFRDGLLLTQLTETTYVDQQLSTGVEYCYQIAVVDSDGDESPLSYEQCETPRTLWKTRSNVPSLSIEKISPYGTGLKVTGNSYLENYTFISEDGLDWSLRTATDVEYTSGTGSTMDAEWDFYNRNIPWLENVTASANSDDIQVAVGEDGIIYSAGRDEDWIDRSLEGVDTDLEDVKWLGDRFIAVGNGGVVLSSEDGMQWQQAFVPYDSASSTTGSLVSVSGTDNNYVAISHSHSYTSTDGISWSAHPSSGPSFTDITWSAEQQQFVAVGFNGGIATSTDGASWDYVLNRDELGGLNTVIWTGQRYIAAGDSSLIVTSSDGISWSSRLHSIDLNAVTWSDNAFLAVGAWGHILRSADGVVWDYVRAGDTSVYYHDIASNGQSYLLAGQTYYSQVDLDLNWIYNDWMGATTVASSVIWDGSRYVMVGSSGWVRTSTDGVNFTVAYSQEYDPIKSPEYLSDVVYGADQYVMVGSEGIIITSSDLVEFTVQTSPVDTWLRSVAFNGTYFTAVGDDGVIDGTLWNSLPELPDAVTELGEMRGIAFNGEERD